MILRIALITSMISTPLGTAEHNYGKWHIAIGLRIRKDHAEFCLIDHFAKKKFLTRFQGHAVSHFPH